MSRLSQWLLIFTSLMLVASADNHVSAALLHPNHVTLAEIEFNSKTGKFEIALCVHPEDLDQVLRQVHAASDDAKDTFRLSESSIDRYAARWLSTEFLVTAQSNREKVLPIRWVGCELDIKKAWLFFEVSGAAQAQTFELENKLFLKLNDDQSNHVKLKHGSDVKWFQSTRKKSKVVIEL